MSITTILNSTVFLPFELLVRSLERRQEKKRSVVRAARKDYLNHYQETIHGNLEVAETFYRSHFRVGRTTAQVTVTNVLTGEMVWHGAGRIVRALFGSISLEKLSDLLIHKYNLMPIEHIRAAMTPVAQYVYCLHIPHVGAEVEDGKGNVLFFSSDEIAYKAADLYYNAFGSMPEVRFSVEFDVEVYQ